MTRLRILGLAFLILLLSSLLLARVHPWGDAGMYAKHPPAPFMPTSFMEDPHIPPEVRSILAAKCADCHSAVVRVPLYGRFAPISWLMESDIVRGRKAMNLAQWSLYSQDQQRNLSEEIVAMAGTGRMPLLQYRLIHWKSRINSTDLATLTRWANQQAAGSSIKTASGRELFNKRCSGCHSLTQDEEGPRLGGIVGRTAGAVASFQYSTALKNAHILWNDDTLDKWLTNPDHLVPGTDMDFYVPKAEERQQIIRYLKSAM